MKRYNPKEIEPRWQKIWEDQKLFHVAEDTSKPKKYVIDMFPYPSGAAMHVGHVRNFTISDVLSQYLRQKGYNVLHTMGWDTFGLPAENYAIKTGTPPAESTKANIVNFKHQLKQLGMSYDWSREVNTSDPEYYRWTQWIFLQLFKNGLAYQAENAQWWCPVDKTVLANEQVEAGKCWRCGSEVVKKSMKQWFFKITDYADQLLEGIDDLAWPEKIKTMQRNWIGKSKGAEITFTVAGHGENLTVFTTRPDALFGATFMVLAPEHPLVNTLTTNDQKRDVDGYVKQAVAKSDIERQANDDEKTGVFTGAYAVNPANNQEIPVWVADFVLGGYGTGAIFGDAHDERDVAFAKKFGIPLVMTINPVAIRDDTPADADFIKKRKVVAVVENDKHELLTINWGDKLGGRLFIGGTVEGDESPKATALREVTEETGYNDLEIIEVGQETFYYKYYAFSKREAHDIEAQFIHLRLKSDARQAQKLDDSEQHNFKVEWIDKLQAEKDVTEPLHRYGFEKFIKRTAYTGEGVLFNSGSYDGMATSEAREKIVADLGEKGFAQEKVNYKMRDWLISRQRYWGAPIPIIHCPEHGAVAVAEDQLPVVLPEVTSFEPTGEGSALQTAIEWVNTTCPVCDKPAKRETDTMDGYACSSWYYLRYTDPTNDQQAWHPEKANYWLPIDYYCGGDHAVSHLLYSRFWMRFFADQGWIEKSRQEPVGRLVYNGYILAHDGNKMSKSKGNVINPDDLIEQGYGADSLRLFEMFIAPYEQNTNWNTNGVPGTFRFLQRFWTLVQEYLEVNNQQPTTNSSDQTGNEALTRVTHQTIAKVSHDLEHLHFNTAVASLMEAVNELYKLKAAQGYAATGSWRFTLESITQLLAPFAPHIAEELWQQLRQSTVHSQQSTAKDSQLSALSSVHMSNWPLHNEKYLVADTITIVVQVNGKVRAQLEQPSSASEADIIAAAQADPRVLAYLENKEVRKTIYVPQKLVNFVIS